MKLNISGPQNSTVMENLSFKREEPNKYIIGKNNQKLIWTDKCEIAFNDIKECVTKSPVLSHLDFSKIFILNTDASFDAIGVVLSQKTNNGKETIIAYGSKSMKLVIVSLERNYDRFFILHTTF